MLVPVAINVTAINPRLDIFRADTFISGHREFEKAAPLGAALKKPLIH